MKSIVDVVNESDVKPVPVTQESWDRAQKINERAYRRAHETRIEERIKNINISLVAAVSRNGVIGNKGGLPWVHISADMSRFRRLTSGNPILMGRKTHESLRRPLPDRTNIVLTSDTNYPCRGCFASHSFAHAISLASHISDQAFVIGGASLYEQALAFNKRLLLHLTIIDEDFDGDTHFPEVDPKEVHVVSKTSVAKGNKSPYNLTFFDAFVVNHNKGKEHEQSSEHSDAGNIHRHLEEQVPTEISDWGNVGWQHT